MSFLEEVSCDNKQFVRPRFRNIFMQIQRVVISDLAEWIQISEYEFSSVRLPRYSGS